MNNINTEYRVSGSIMVNDIRVDVDFTTQNNKQPDTIYVGGTYGETYFRGNVSEKSFEIIQNGTSTIPELFLQSLIVEARKILTNYLNY